MLSVSRSPARSFKKAELCHQFGSRSAHGFDHEAPCPRQPARASPAVRRAKGHGSVFRANHRETPSDEIGRRALSGSRFGRSAFNALTLWRKAFRDVSVSVRRNRTRRRRLGTYRPGNPDGRLIERRRHRPDASRDRLPSRTARRRAQINRAGVVARPRPRGLSHAAQRRKASGQQQKSSHVQPLRIALPFQITPFHSVFAMQYKAFRPAAAQGRGRLHDRAFPGERHRGDRKKRQSQRRFRRRPSRQCGMNHGHNRQMHEVAGKRRLPHLTQPRRRPSRRGALLQTRRQDHPENDRRRRASRNPKSQARRSERGSQRRPTNKPPGPTRAPAAAPAVHAAPAPFRSKSRQAAPTKESSRQGAA